MHCSYAWSPTKHDIKAVMIAQMRRGLLDAGCTEWDGAPPPAVARPTIVVTTENFSEGHSVYRTHSRAVTALRSAFNVVGVLHAAHVSPAIEACFDEIILYAGEPGFFGHVRRVADQILARRPAMVLHLGVGMSSFVIGLASLRLAPVQAASFGHTATTRSPEIDAMILPDDFVGDPACFSERLVRLPPAAMPYNLRDDIDFAAIGERARAARDAGRPGPHRRAGVGDEAGSAPVRRPGAGGGPGADAGRISRLPAGLRRPGLRSADAPARRAPADGGRARGTALRGLHRAPGGLRFFVCPFPYGNMNSIVDAVMVGLPGVCLDGPEAHAHADVAYFRRLGLPAELTASNLDDYVAAIARLVDDPDWLAQCQAAARRVDRDHPFFSGDEGLFVAAVEDLIR
ncbi:MAG: hypothetical protein WDM85_09380 [Caulobacteraceae bacterium]